jgi:hypothetical protein
VHVSHTSYVDHAGSIFSSEQAGNVRAVRQASHVADKAIRIQMMARASRQQHVQPMSPMSSNDAENRYQLLSSSQVANVNRATLELELSEFSIGSTTCTGNGSTSVLGILSFDNISFVISYVKYIDGEPITLSTVIGCLLSSAHRLFLNLDVKLISYDYNIMEQLNCLVRALHHKHVKFRDVIYSKTPLRVSSDSSRSASTFDILCGQVIEHIDRPVPAPDPTLSKYLWWVNNYVHSNPSFHVHYHMWTCGTVAAIWETRVYTYRHDSAMGSRMDPKEPPDNETGFKLELMENDNDDVAMVYNRRSFTAKRRGVSGYFRC